MYYINFSCIIKKKNFSLSILPNNLLIRFFPFFSFSFQVSFSTIPALESTQLPSIPKTGTSKDHFRPYPTNLNGLQSFPGCTSLQSSEPEMQRNVRPCRSVRNSNSHRAGMTTTGFCLRIPPVREIRSGLVRNSWLKAH